MYRELNKIKMIASALYKNFELKYHYVLHPLSQKQDTLDRCP